MEARFFEDSKGYTIVYTDGACINNGQSKAKAGVGVWFSDGNLYNVSRPVNGRATNNVAEIEAATEAARQALMAGKSKLRIMTDSDFMIQSLNEYIPKWLSNNWRTYDGGEVKNKEQFLDMLYAFKQLEDVEFVHVNSHSGIYGNDRADQLARQGAQSY